MTKSTPISISDVIQLLPPDEKTNGGRGLIERAYATAKKAHAKKKRKSGEAYIHHPLAVAYLLTEIGMDPDTIAAGLLHDVVEDTDIDLASLKKTFGPQIATLVDGVTKLDQIEQEQSDRFKYDCQAMRDAQESESLRKMLLAMAHDIRVVVIKLADRLHNMRTLDALKPERRRSFARETMDIFAPLANRLGVWQWKWELEDLSLRHLDPDTYYEIAALIEERRVERETSVQRHIDTLRRRLDAEEINAEITGRPKQIYSIYRKMQRKNVHFDQVYDVRGIRVLTDTIPDCYRVLGIVHGLWSPVPGEFDDYIATPKDNLYQSLHTAVISGDGKTLEVQIRTREMHEIAETGIAAHWRYKEGGKRDKAFEARIAWMRWLMELRQELPDAGEFLDAIKTDIFEDRVYAFTPKGKLIELPIGATPVDFAYHIHTEVGHRCRGARVNGKLVSLEYELHSGDQVEILTSRRGGPSRDWLNPALGYVKTNRAATKIRQWFRRQDREQNIAQGREIVERELKRLNLEISHESVAKMFNYDKLEDFAAAIGFGDINSQQVASKIAEVRAKEEKEQRPFVPPAPVETIEGVQVQGTGGLLTRLARCCNPLPGNEIVGYVTRGRGVTIHRRDCPNILRLQETERMIEVGWGARTQTVPAMIYIRAYDRPKLLSEISAIIGAEDINITSVNHTLRNNISTFHFALEINDIAQLSRVLTKIERIHNIIEAYRHTG
jgi:RelA/SpoT family (p)ppGpp synthetase